MTDVPLNNESGRASGRCPPPDLLIAAFRKAMGHRSGQETQQKWQKDGSSRHPDEEAETTHERGTGTIVDWAEKMLAAFRKANGVVWGDHGDGHTHDQGSPERTPTEDPTEVPETRPSPSESTEDAGTETVPDGEMSEGAARPDELLDPSEDLALAFRRAFYRRRVRRKITPQEGSAEESTRRVVLPPRPASSFLWVSDEPEGGPKSIKPQHLSGLRARRAAAFLLRGEGKTPYRLLRCIRRHSESRIFLKPVFWRGGADQESPVVDHVDGTWSPRADREALWGLREQAAAINRRIRDVVEGDGAARGTDAERRLLRFVATRTDEFSPRRIEGSVVYPKLRPLLGG